MCQASNKNAPHTATRTTVMASYKSFFMLLSAVTSASAQQYKLVKSYNRSTNFFDFFNVRDVSARQCFFFFFFFPSSKKFLTVTMPQKNAC